MGSTVFFRRTSSHDVSFRDRPDALRIVGLSEGQSPPFGAYPLGAFTAILAAFRASSRGTVADAVQNSNSHQFVAIGGNQSGGSQNAYLDLMQLE